MVVVVVVVVAAAVVVVSLFGEICVVAPLYYNNKKY